MRGTRHVVGRFIYYLTDEPAGRAVFLHPPIRHFSTPLRWNLDEAGEAQLEIVFRHKGRPARLEGWEPAPEIPPTVSDPLKTC